MMKWIATLLSTIALLALPALPVAAHHPNPVRAAIDAGADRLVDLQNADGGWFFTVGDADCGLGAGVSCPNTFGITALGLADAYPVTHDGDQINAAIRAANALIAKHGAAPACDGNPATSADRPFTVDATFLTDISHIGRVGKIVGSAAKKNYRKVARDWFECVMADFPSAAARANNRIDGRIAQGLDNLGAWDASLDVRAALDVDEKSYALAEALQIIARAPDWDVADPQCVGCETLSKGLFLAATEELRHNTAIKNARNLWKAQLLAAQLPDGSWNGDTQITAYVVMGLVESHIDKNTRKALNAGVAFLMSQQLPNGGFDTGFGDEVTEVDAEAVQALVAAKRFDDD